MNNWRECIDYIIKIKIEDAVRRKKRKELYNKQNGITSNDKPEKKDAKEFFKKGGRFFKKIMQTKEDKFKEELRQNQNMIFNELSHFVQHFINLNLPFE